jgi:DNA-binding MarR family transcriptional regulator
MMRESQDAALGSTLHDLFREIFALQAALASIMDEVHAKTGLGTPQLKILRRLCHMGPATVPAMAARLGVSRQSVQTACNGLQSLGILEFRDNPRHKGSNLIGMTEAGRSAYQKARLEEAAIIAKSFPQVDAERAKEARGLLAQIRQGLVDH